MRPYILEARVRFPSQSLCQFALCGFQLAHQADAGAIPCLQAAADTCPIPKHHNPYPPLQTRPYQPLLPIPSHMLSPRATKDPSMRTIPAGYPL